MKLDIERNSEAWIQLVSAELKSQVDREVSAYLRSEECRADWLAALIRLDARTNNHVARRTAEIAAGEGIGDEEAAQRARDALTGTLAFRAKVLAELERARIAEEGREVVRLRQVVAALAREFDPQDWNDILGELPKEAAEAARAAVNRRTATAA